MLSSLCIQSLKAVALIDAKLIRSKNAGKKEKWTNEGTDQPYVANSLIHSYNLSYLMFVSNFIILGQVVPKKSLTKVSIFIRDIVSKGLKYRFPSQIDFNRCREEIASV